METSGDRRMGLEQEFFLVDGEGVLSNRADEFLACYREAARGEARSRGLRPRVLRVHSGDEHAPRPLLRRVVARVPGGPPAGP